MTEPFHPLERDFPNLRENLLALLTVPVRRCPPTREEFFSMEDAPYDVLAAQAVMSYPFTKELFMEMLAKLTEELARFINEAGEFRAYPIRFPQRKSDGVAMVDFIGIQYQFDLRVVMMVQPFYNFAPEGEEPRLGTAVKVFLTTLVAKL